MTVSVKWRAVASAIILPALLSSCLFMNVFERPPCRVEMGTNGRFVFIDTPDCRADMARAMNSHIAHELSGGKPPGEGWNDFWLNLIRKNADGGSVGAFNIDYIIATRRGVGLPELQGYPPAVRPNS